MCKIAVFPMIKEGKEKEAWKLALALTPLLTASDNDGFGYMALSDKGLYGERWVNTKQAFKKRRQIKNTPELMNYADVFKTIEGYNTFGDRGKRTFSLALHARKATCGVSLGNTHPFVDDTATLGIIHNGVITNSSQLGVATSGCDSEAILNMASKFSVSEDIEHWQSATAELTGWYAVAAFVKDAQNTWHLDIVKDSMASLYAGYVDQLEAVVFCTSQEVLLKAAKAAGMTVSGIYEVLDDVAIRHDAKTGGVTYTLQLEATDTREASWNGHYGNYNRGKHGGYLDHWAGYDDSGIERAEGEGYNKHTSAAEVDAAGPVETEVEPTDVVDAIEASMLRHSSEH